MFSHWIWGIFNIQIQSDRKHKLMLFVFQNKDILRVIANW